MGECVDKRIPWMVWEAIDRLREIVKPNDRVFEWGSGGSTLFWLDMGCHVVSIDHTPGWPAKVLARVSEKHVESKRLVIKHVRHVPGSSRGFGSAVVQGCFREYATEINNHGVFDIVCVDGRARVACIDQAIDHIVPGGLLILDNSDRPRYSSATSKLHLAGWTSEVFTGTGPEGHGISWSTTFFRKP